MSRVDGPRPGWKVYPEWKQKEMAEKRQRMFELRRDAKEFAKLEGFMEANKKAAANFFEDKLNFVSAMIDTVRDEYGDIDPNKVAEMDPRKQKILLEAFDRIEKSAGFAQKTTEHKHTHTLTLADKFKELQGGSDEEVVDVEVVEDE